jgi:predicted acetyltransferase
MTARLVRPAAIYRASYVAAVREYQPEGRYLDYDPDWLASPANFAWLVDHLHRKTMTPAPGRVPQTVFWLAEDDNFIGRASLRHDLNEGLRQFGGHIGYDIRPSKRRRGYGTLICKLALVEARRLGLARVLITCDADNTGSRKIIEANGGQLERTVLLEGRSVPTLHFWITLG